MLFLLEFVCNLCRGSSCVCHHRAIWVESIPVFNITLRLRYTTDTRSTSIDHMAHWCEMQRSLAHTSTTVEYISSYTIWILSRNTVASLRSCVLSRIIRRLSLSFVRRSALTRCRDLLRDHWNWTNFLTDPVLLILWEIMLEHCERLLIIFFVVRALYIEILGWSLVMLVQHLNWWVFYAQVSDLRILVFKIIAVLKKVDWMVSKGTYKLVLPILIDLLSMILRISRDLTVVEVVIVERRTRLALVRVKSIFGSGLPSLNHALKHSSLMQRSSRGSVILLLLIKGMCWGFLVRIPHWVLFLKLR